MPSVPKQPNPQAGYRAVFRCIDGCPGEYALDEVIYRCPRCGELLEVVHDLDPIRSTESGRWREIFEERFRSSVFPLNSGVWGKNEFVCPGIRTENIVSTGEGATALVPAERLGSRLGLEKLWIKQCGSGHTGSFKDLGMTVLVSMVRQMRREGKPIPAVACASTGDTSASLAAYCALAGIPSVVFLPRDKISQGQLVQPLAHGAVTLALDTDFDGCMKIVRKVAERDKLYLANSMNSLRIEGQKTIGIEICQQLGWQAPDWVVIPGGNLGNISALGKGLRMMLDVGLIDRPPRILAAQAESANPLYRSYLNGFDTFEAVEAKPTLAGAIRIGDPVSARKAIRVLKEFRGIVEQASEQELAEAAAEGDRAGFYICPHTAVALAALGKAVLRGEVAPNDRVVVISTAHGLKFSEFKSRYHAARLEGIDTRHANPPIEVAGTYEAVHDALFRALEKHYF